MNEHVIKRNGEAEDFNPNKVLFRIKNMCALDDPKAGKDHKIVEALASLNHVNYDRIARQVIGRIYDGITTSELDDIAAALVAPLGFEHPEYEDLASRILVSNLHKSIESDLCGHFNVSEEDIERRGFYYTCSALWENVNQNLVRSPLIAPHVMAFVSVFSQELEDILQRSRDFNFKYAGFVKLHDSYLLRCGLKRNGEYRRANGHIERFVVETPQYMWLRVSIGIFLDGLSTIYNDHDDYKTTYDVWSRENTGTDASEFWDGLLDLFTAKYSGTSSDIMSNVKNAYDLMSSGKMTHATPTLFHAGGLVPQLSSCFLTTIPDDSMDAIADYWKRLAMIAKWAGGLGSHVHHIRPAGSYIAGTGGTSNGLPKMLKVVNEIALYVDQCFEPGTWVYTSVGPKKMSDIVVGDMLITNDGTLQKVQNVRQFEHSGPIRRIQLKHSIEPFMVTEKHPLLAVKAKKGLNQKTIINRLNKGYIKPEYTRIKDLTTDHFVAIPIPTVINDIENYDTVDCYMYGVMIGDGSISANLKTYQVCLNNTTKTDIVEFVKKYLNDRQITFYEQIINNCLRITWYRSHLFPFTRAMLYNSQGDKIVHPSMHHLSLDKNIQIIKGVIDTDGHIPTKIGSTTVKKSTELTLEMSSRELIESIRYMLLRHGVPTGGYTRDRAGETHEIRPGEFITTKKPSAILRLPKCQMLTDLFNIKPGRFVNYFTHGGIMYSRITMNDETEYDGILVDFDMETNENYLTHVGLAHNGGNKRPGSHALYLEPWHGDIVEFLDLKRGRGNMEKRAKSLFYAVWLNDEFMRTVEREEVLSRNGETNPKLWYLMDPTISRGLPDAFDQVLRIGWISDEELFSGSSGDKFGFTHLYRSYIREGKFMKRVSATSIWKQICEITQETGIPYKLHKDAANRKTNQNNLGTIKSSNLCTEIIEYSDANETAVCNLASICVGDFVVYEKPANADNHKYADGFAINTDLTPTGVKSDLFLDRGMNVSKSDLDLLKSRSVGWFDFKAFENVVRTAVLNLNKVIDNNYYPIPSTKLSNSRHRPIGLGVQGLADMFSRLWLPFGSESAINLDAYVFERMYYAALDQSCILAEKDGHYETFQGSWASQGVLQFDLWKREHDESDHAKFDTLKDFKVSQVDDIAGWDALKTRIKNHGLRNSLLMAPMPTASTSTIMGNSPAFEPHNALIYKRSDKHGESNVCNRDLQEALLARNLWTPKVQNELMNSRIGSIQDILEIPLALRAAFKTAFDMSPKVVINHALARAPFIDQSMSMNLFIPNPSSGIITKMHFYSWKRGIKTGGYYLRRIPPADAKKIQLTPSDVSSVIPEQDEIEVYGEVCAPDCDSCGA